MHQGPANPEEVKQTIREEISAGRIKFDVREADADDVYYVRRERYEKYRRLKDDNDPRKMFGEVILVITILWICSVIIILLRCGNGKAALSDSVLITLLTTSTANVFGFLYVVVNYLFNKEKST